MTDADAGGDRFNLQKPGPPMLRLSPASRVCYRVPRGGRRDTGLWPGEYVIVATAPSRFGGAATQPAAATTTAATCFPGTADVSAAQPVALQSDETISNLIIPLVSVPAFKISGVVVDGAGSPVANAMVMLTGGQRGSDLLLSLVAGPPLMSQSDAGGRFVFDDVPAGAYMLRADAGFGGVGLFGFTDTFGIDIDGTPRADSSRPKPAREPGTIEVTVDNADVSDLRIVVTGAQ